MKTLYLAEIQHGYGVCWSPVIFEDLAAARKHWQTPGTTIYSIETKHANFVELIPADDRANILAAARKRLDSLDNATLAALANGDLISTEPKGGA